VSRGSTKGSRPYRMTKRSEAVDDTRQRIIEATVTLHGTVGPAATTVMGIAEQAGVTRATVYRHFPDDTTLFEACSNHWLSQQVPPNASEWLRHDDPFERMRVALTDLYRFYRAGESMLRRIYRDKQSLPQQHREGLDARHEFFCDALLAPFSVPLTRRPLVRAAIGHAVGFWTWRSLCIDNGLEDRDAVELMVGLTAAAVSPPSRTVRSRRPPASGRAPGRRGR
jgi:AcrR family transcriptional regulator